MNNPQTKRHGLSKSRILLHRQCPKRLWLKVHRPELEEVDDGNQARFATGTYVGELAQQLYPDGILIDGNDLGQAVIDTQAILAGEKRPIFEATLQADGLLIRADLMLPDQNGYRMVEVKSSTSVKDYYLTDAAIQSWVAQQAELSLTSVEIAHIDNTFVYPGGGDYRGLFRYADVSEQISGMKDEVPDWINAARETLSGDEPCIAPGGQCSVPFDCPFFSYCSPTIENKDGFPPEVLPYGKALTATLRAEGYADLRDVPEERIEGWKHQRVWRATKCGQAELNPEAGRIIAALPYPRYYIDFETINPAVPVWVGTRPYMQVPFQWSCHIETAKGVMTHLAYLADGQSDPRRPFAMSLIEAVGTDGPIFVYHAPFERSRMQEIAAYCPDLAPALEAAIDRIVDLLPIAREHYYHPDMRGSWSIKVVLPTIAPELAYDDLEVANGGMAQEAFSEIMQPETLPERSQQLSDALLLYCERDTLAMVRIAHYFENGS
ncbi:MAG: DUF2779 domain-containing protein [Methylotenera sp.]|uniref:DUF2779 domain-containing protein n=1 Tax=Methylotenera sp. TaxID=2051956 RepID=UPI0027316BF3|nr:DUF2779 domain-containing protein [Methylotenera sp.]MDP1523318.1 DUF2779 domain-containing protein [Methylotenera sp.]